jgi:hypothetical protein
LNFADEVIIPKENLKNPEFAAFTVFELFIPS